MDSLFTRMCDVNDDVFRNIVSLRHSEHLFDDLTDGNMELHDVAIAAEMRVKQHISSDWIERGFHYSTAIAYPFETEPFMASRYGNGNFGVWYGSIDSSTTIYETVYHMVEMEKNIAPIDSIIYRERAVYKVHCHALVLDLRNRQHDIPDLVSDDYSYTQQIASRLHKEGHPGLLAPSARCSGTNVVVFNPQVLTQARPQHYLTYCLDLAAGKVRVEKQTGKILMEITLPSMEVCA